MSFCKLQVQHICKKHPFWIATREGQDWVASVNVHIDAGAFRTKSSFAFAHQRSVCPVCREPLETQPSCVAECLPSLHPGSARCSPHGPAPRDWHPIMVAVWYNDVDYLQALLKDPKTLGQIDNGPGFGDERNALYHAVRYKFKDIVRVLLQARADPHKQIRHSPKTPQRPCIFTSPYFAALDESHYHIADVFHDVVYNGVALPPPPPPPEHPPQESTGGACGVCVSM